MSARLRHLSVPIALAGLFACAVPELRKAAPPPVPIPPPTRATGCAWESFGLPEDKVLVLSRAVLVAEAVLALETHVDSELKKTCGGLRGALDGEPNDVVPKEPASEVCQAAIKAVNDRKATLGPKVRLSLDVGKSACGIRLEEVRACLASCDKGAIGPKDGLECEAGKTSGRCKGTCSGRCNDKESRGACDGICSGKCAGAFEEPACDGELKVSPALAPDCRTACEASAIPHALCPSPKVTLEVANTTSPAQSVTFARAVSVHVPGLLRVSHGIGPRVSSLSLTAQGTVERGYDVLLEVARTKDSIDREARDGGAAGGDGARLRGCFESKLRNASAASGRLKADVDIAVNLRASLVTTPPR